MFSKKSKHTIRTVIQASVGFAVALPGLVAASGVDETTPWVAAGLGASAVVTRLMATSYVQSILGCLNTEEDPQDGVGSK